MSVILSLRGRDALRVVWAVLALCLAVQAYRGIVRDGHWPMVVYLVLNVQIAILFLRRGREIARTRRVYPYVVALSCLPYLWLYDHGARVAAPSQYVGWAFVVIGGAVCFAAAWALGSAYGVLPIVRGVRSHGLYRVVRHPLYLGSLLMNVGIVAASPSKWNVAIGIGGALLLAARAHCEEIVLYQLAEYRAYSARTRFRLIPFVY